MSKTNNYKEYLIESIKTAGEMITEQAENIVGECDGISGLRIHIDLGNGYDTIPEITIERSHVPSIPQMEKLFDVRRNNHKFDRELCARQVMRGETK